MARNFSIFGSCVTRDVFGFGQHSNLVDGYVARSTIASAVSGQIEFALDSEDVGFSSISPFEQRMIRGDIEKNCFSVLSESSAAEVIVDLIDERFSIIEVAGGYLTESASFVKAGLLQRLPDGAQKISFLSRDEVDRQALVAFAGKLRQTGKRIFIHKAFWATSFVDNGQLLDFEKKDFYARMNDGLVWRYELLSDLLPEAAVLQAPADSRVSDPAHRWGLAPFHYVPSYYDSIRAQLDLN
ncbi:DUF6270 domain-containing protein [Stenotrophomonas sp. PS02298]|uniref:DUF6270 domain-containing protein n=1 Tax=Stenotrophomonas sp. PS02298 TaxID=2991424 RepID=UPI002499C77B|nr:DUF6270 domain-containing protein [Stenotrophomonas sp. PS02298]